MGGNVGLDVEVEGDEVFGYGEAAHLENFKDNSFTVLRLVEGGVVIGDEGGGGDVGLSPLRELRGGMAAVDVEVGGPIPLVEDTLVLLHGAEHEDDEVMHQGESLAGFPGAKYGAVIYLVLGFREDFDGRVAPVWI